MEYTVNGNSAQGRNGKIRALPVRLENIPDDLKTLNQWVVWLFEHRDVGKKPTKVPYVGTNELLVGVRHAHARTNDPSTWVPFTVVAEEYKARNIDGIGIVLKDSDPYTGVDIDHCYDPESGEISLFARGIIDRLNSYTEVSPSGTGVRIIVVASLPRNQFGRTRCRDDKLGIEIYDRTRFLTMTGHHITGTPSTPQARQAELDRLHAELFPPQPQADHAQGDRPTLGMHDQEIIDLAGLAANGAKFKKLWEGRWEGQYESQSSADQALCNLLTFYTRDEGQLDRLFRASGLMRDKWERSDYRERTLGNALEAVTDTYNGPGLLGRLEAEVEGIVKAVERSEGEQLPHDQGVDPQPQRTAAEVLGDVLGEKLKASESAPTDYRKAYSLAELDALPPLEWLVDQHIPTGAFGCVFGVSGSAKSFFALDVALCIATGKPFLDAFPVQKGPVLYICSEGGRGIKKRVHAWLKHHGMSDPGQIKFVPAPFNLLAKDEATALLKIACRDLGAMPVLTIIDTLSRNMVGNERESKDVMEYVGNVDYIIRATGGAAVSIHHSGWNIDRERGASNLRDSCDVMIQLVPDNPQNTTENARTTVSCTKMKDDDPFESYIVGKKLVGTSQGTSCVWPMLGTVADLKRDIVNTKMEETEMKQLELEQAFLTAVPIGKDQAVNMTTHRDQLGWSKTAHHRMFHRMLDAGKVRTEPGKGPVAGVIWREI